MIMETRLEDFSKFYEGDSSVIAAALYGSRARGDYNKASDTDILLVTSDTKPKHISEGSCSLSFYSKSDLIEKATDGDLFVCHIVYEAKPLKDQNGFFDCLRKQFHFRKSYDQEIKHASDLGWFLFNYSKDFDNHKIANKRVAWCVRTILIAQSAERKNPIFAASELAESVESSAVRRLIKNKDIDQLDKKLFEEFARFLKNYATSDANQNMPISSYLMKFRASENKVALNTFRALFTDEHSLAYE